jgi:hypothetical protein
MHLVFTSVAEPEPEPKPVEQQLFAGAGAGAKVFLTRLRLRSRVCKNPKFFIPKFDVDFKNDNFVAIYFKETFDDHLCL